MNVVQYECSTIWMQYNISTSKCMEMKYWHDILWFRVGVRVSSPKGELKWYSFNSNTKKWFFYSFLDRNCGKLQ